MVTTLHFEYQPSLTLWHAAERAGMATCAGWMFGVHGHYMQGTNDPPLEAEGSICMLQKLD